MHSTRTDNRDRRRQAGLSMVELLVAMLVLAVGMMGSMILVRTAIVNNNRNKMDTAATALAQMVLEHITSRSISAAGNITVTDCAGVNRVINPNGAAAPGAGATLIPSGFNQGNIDFSQDFTTVPAGYAMQYITCGPAPGTPGAAAGGQVTYEVRWNITNMPNSGFTRLVTVSARKRITTATGALPFFAVPVTLRSIQGQ